MLEKQWWVLRILQLRVSDQMFTAGWEGTPHKIQSCLRSRWWEHHTLQVYGQMFKAGWETAQFSKLFKKQGEHGVKCSNLDGDNAQNTRKNFNSG